MLRFLIAAVLVCSLACAATACDVEQLQSVDCQTQGLHSPPQAMNIIMGQADEVDTYDVEERGLFKGRIRDRVKERREFRQYQKDPEKRKALFAKASKAPRAKSIVVESQVAPPAPTSFLMLEQPGIFDPCTQSVDPCAPSLAD